MKPIRHCSLTFLIFLTTISFCQAQVAVPRDRLSLYLKVDSSRKLTTLLNTPASVEISTQTVSVHKNDRIAFVLLKAKLEPGLEMYELLYLLNPQIKRLDSLPDNQQLLLPVIRPVKTSLQNGQLIAIRFDEALKNQILEKTKQIVPVLSSPDTTGIKSLLAGADAYEKFKDIVLQLDKLAAAIRERTIILSYEQLKDIDTECDVLVSVVKQSPATKPIDIVTIDKNFNEWTRSVFERKGSGSLPKNNSATVYASVIKVVDNKKVKLAGYTIYYSSPGLEGKNSYSFGESSSSTDSVKASLAECTWKFWAAAKGELPSDTQFKTQSIRIDKNNIIELILTVIK